MYKISLPIILSIFFLLMQKNCLSQFSKIAEDKIISNYDEFKKISSSYVQIFCESVEAESNFLNTYPNFTLKANFFRSSNSDSSITVSFSLALKNRFEPLDSTVFINVNDSILKIRAYSISKNLIDEVSTSTTGVGSEERITNIKSNSYLIYTGKFDIPLDIFKQIQPRDKFKIRMYLECETATFNFNGPETRLLNKLVKEP